MPTDLTIGCACGELCGVLRGVSPPRGNRVVCYCDDCQSFIHFLGQSDQVLDPHGGTDIFQTSPARLVFTSGAERISCVRLREGTELLRWYSACCNTPICNTMMSRGTPFVGMILHGATRLDGGSFDDSLGPVRFRGYARFAKGDRDSLNAHRKLPLSYWLLVSWMVLKWWLRGDGNRSPFLDASGGLIAEPRVLTQDELREVEAARDAS